MNYTELNQYFKNRTKGQISSTQYDWEDKQIANILLGKLPRIDFFALNGKLSNEANDFLKYYNSYSFIDSISNSFQSTLENKWNSINNKRNYYFDLNEVKKSISFHKSILINGAGGVGKTFFIFKLEEQLTKLGVNHLCIYGKFFKDLNDIDFSEIISIGSDREFVFVVDAFNEISESLQEQLCKKIEELYKIKGIRLIITYRDFRLSEKIKKKLIELLNNQYSFPGISFESALDSLIKIGVSNLYNYIDYLFTNNAGIIKSLVNILNDTSEKDRNAKVNNITFITNLYEQELKKTVKDDNWQKTKKIANWMYQHNKKSIPKTEMYTQISLPNEYVQTMQEYNYLIEERNGTEIYYKLTQESLSDSIIARSFFEDLNGKTESQIITLLSDKIDHFPELIDFFILVLFDKYGKDLELIARVIKTVGIKFSLTGELITKILFKNIDIKKFQELFCVYSNPTDALLYTCGYYDKAFNCINYLNTILFNQKKSQLYMLTKSLASNNYLALRLKNTLYFINSSSNSIKKECLDEFFYFSLWCAAFPNEKCRNIAEKVLYDIIEIESAYQQLLTQVYSNIHDYYIKNSIIKILSKKPRKHEIISFFKNIISQGKNDLDEYSVCYISRYLGKNESYINWPIPDLLVNSEKQISDYLKTLLSTVYHNRSESHFTYYYDDKLDYVTPKFYQDSKLVKKINIFLFMKKICIFNKIRKFTNSRFYDCIANLKTLSDSNLLCSLDARIQVIADEYNFSNELFNFQRIYQDNFSNSFLFKVYKIALNTLYASLMCNYYQKENIYDLQDKLHIGLYNSILYEEERFNLCSPVNVNQDLVDGLEDKLLLNITLPQKKDEIWGNNIILSEQNIEKLLSPIDYKKEKWNVLAVTCDISEYKDNYSCEWKDTYIISCTDTKKIRLSEKNPREQTIDRKNYIENVSEYVKKSTNKNLCCSIPNNGDVLDETNLLFPPSSLINKMKLHFDNKTCCWKNSSEETVIVCNNNLSSYRKWIKNSIFIRNDYYEKYRLSNKLRYFVYIERLINGSYNNAASYCHFQIDKNKITNRVKT